MKVTIAQLRAQSEGELKQELARCEAELQKLRFDRVFNKIKNVKALSEARKKKARVLTLLREKRVL